MRRILLFLVSLFCGLTVLFGGTGVSYASDKESSKIVTITKNTKLEEMNKKLEFAIQLNIDDMAELKQYSNIQMSELGGEKVQLIVSNNTPERSVYYDDGSVVREYTTAVITGDYDETYQTLDVELYIKMTFSVYEYNGYQFCKLNYGYGKLVNCWENGYRNLKIVNTVWGNYQNPNGSSGISGEIKNSSTISSPSIGTLYSISSPSTNYYGTEAGTGLIRVTVSIEWRHGTKWYTTSYSITK